MSKPSLFCFFVFVSDVCATARQVTADEMGKMQLKKKKKKKEERAKARTIAINDSEGDMIWIWII
jgi:hypothetical protein